MTEAGRNEAGQGASADADRAVVNGAGQAVSALRASVPSAAVLAARAREMGEHLSDIRADIPEPTCPQIDRILCDIKEPRRLADRYAGNISRVDVDELTEFPSLVDTALWGLPDDLEALRNANDRLREGVHELGAHCHEAGALLLELAQAIEARRAETGTGSVHESAVHEVDAPNG